MKTLVYQVDSYCFNQLNGRQAANYTMMREYCAPSVADWAGRMGYDHVIKRPTSEEIKRRSAWDAAMVETINFIPELAEGGYDRAVFLDYDMFVPEDFGDIPWQPGKIVAPNYGKKAARHKMAVDLIREELGIEMPGFAYLFCAVAMDKETAARMQVPKRGHEAPPKDYLLNDELTLMLHAHKHGVPFHNFRPSMASSCIKEGKMTHFGGQKGKEVIRRAVTHYENEKR